MELLEENCYELGLRKDLLNTKPKAYLVKEKRG